jgi:hypothetical protein
MFIALRTLKSFRSVERHVPSADTAHGTPKGVLPSPAGEL